MRYQSNATHSANQSGVLEQSLITVEGKKVVCTLRYNCHTENDRYEVTWAVDYESVSPVMPDGMKNTGNIVRLSQYQFSAEDLAAIRAMHKRMRVFLAMLEECKPAVYEVRTAQQVENKTVG